MLYAVVTFFILAVLSSVIVSGEVLAVPDAVGEALYLGCLAALIVSLALYVLRPVK